MAIPDHPTPVSPFLDRPGLDQDLVQPALHLHGGRLWVASCPTCGLELARARTQQRVERRAAARTCPICRGGKQHDR